MRVDFPSTHEPRKKTDIKKLAGVASIVATFFAAQGAHAANIEQQNLRIQKVRAVGNYQGDVYDNTVELWFTTPLSWPAGSVCVQTGRVYVDSSNKHMVAAAYFALQSNLPVGINVDESLPVRAVACEISFLDVLRP